MTTRVELFPYPTAKWGILTELVLLDDIPMFSYPTAKWGILT